MPPQPAGVWQIVYSKEDLDDANGPDRYRRALYTFCKRSAAVSGLSHLRCSGARGFAWRGVSPTNTPLQALVTLNDVVYHEAARALAERVRRMPASASGRATR